MMSISILVAILTCGAAELCQIRTANDLANAKDCTELQLYANDEVMKNPLLFDKIKTATTYRHFELNGTELEKISEAKEVLLPKGSTVTIFDNANLRELPKFNIVDANAIKLSVTGNPKLDTKQLLMECGKKRCSQETLNNIQVPFSCRPITPMPSSCRIVFGTLPLHLYHYSWGTIETLYGTITLENSQLKRAPKLEMLEQVIQLKNRPVLVVKNNSKLEEIDSLLDLDYVIVDDEGVGPAQMEKNPNLCIDLNHAYTRFVKNYMKNVEKCDDRLEMAEFPDNRKARDLRKNSVKSSIFHKKGLTDAPEKEEPTTDQEEPTEVIPTHEAAEAAESSSQEEEPAEVVQTTHGAAEAVKTKTVMGDKSPEMTTVDQNMTTTASEIPKVESNESFVDITKAEINGTTESVTTSKKPSGGLKGFFAKILPKSGSQSKNFPLSIFLLSLKIV